MIFLYDTPFINKDRTSRQHDYLIDEFTDNDRSDVDKMHQMLIKFAFDNNIIVRTDTGIVTSTPQNNVGSWMWAVNWISFRALEKNDNLKNFIYTLEQNDHDPMNQIIDLYVRLGVLFDHRLLNTIVDRTITSIKTIPYISPDDDDRLTWETIHIRYPFLWVLILIQTLIKTNTDPLK